MEPSDFFELSEIEDWSLRGLDPEDRYEPKLRTNLINALRTRKLADIDDIEAAYGLARLAHAELEAYGTTGKTRLDDEEMTSALRGLKGVLGRLRIDFSPPFRDFRGFHGYWSANGMSGGGG